MKTVSPDQELDIIRRKLGYLTLDQSVKYWLDTGSPKLNSVLGSPTKGLAYGKMIELSGLESNGKTLLMLLIASLAQDDGAVIGWMDLENSFDAKWAVAQGLDPKAIYLFQPRIGNFNGEKKARLQTAEELCMEVEAWLAHMHKKNPGGKIFLGLDSVTAFLVEDEAVAGLADANMRTKMALASFLGRLLRRWVSLAVNYNVMMVFINQIRISPMAFGNPEYTTGGKALRFYCSIRAQVRRVKNGKLLQKGQMVGLRGKISNIKNKAGEGSVEGMDCGFKAMFLKHDWKFVTVKDIKEQAEEGS